MAHAAQRIGFIGASGLMGHGMAKNLITKGFKLTLMARNVAAVEDLLALGATLVGTPAAVAASSDVVFLCVTGSPQIEEIVLTADTGLLGAARPGLTVVDTSTSEPSSTARLRALLLEKGALFVDAPLARTPKEAEEGRLNIMVGADDAVFAALRPVLAAFSENIIHTGGPGTGATLKLVNNFIAQAIATATAEGLATAAKAGLSLKKVHEVVSAGGVNSGIFQMMAGKMLADDSGDLSGLKFTLVNAAKDIGYYKNLTRELGTSAVVGDAVLASLEEAKAMGFGDKYVASLFEVQEKKTGVTIVPRKA